MIIIFKSIKIIVIHLNKVNKNILLNINDYINSI